MKIRKGIENVRSWKAFCGGGEASPNIHGSPVGLAQFYMFVAWFLTGANLQISGAFAGRP